MLNLKPGQEVLYKNEKWHVLYVWCNRDNVVVRLTLGHLKFTDYDGNSTGWRLEETSVDPEEVSEYKRELTAKEYAEKLKKALGYENCKNRPGADPEDEICVGLGDCNECPFCCENRKGVFEGSCEALIVYHPDLAMKMMDEWQAERKKPKSKTYLEDFRERLPNATIRSDGRPACCRDVMYKKRDWARCPKTCSCSACWNEVMPEEVDNAER